ncbi:MAG: hypothetical protein ACR5LF_10360 [Symbiopectobacterium sp.]
MALPRRKLRRTSVRKWPVNWRSTLTTVRRCPRLTSRKFPCRCRAIALVCYTFTNRLLHIHENCPGVLTAINTIFAKQGINIAAQYLQTSADIGYMVIDVETDAANTALQLMKAIPGTISARLLF